MAGAGTTNQVVIAVVKNGALINHQHSHPGNPDVMLVDSYVAASPEQACGIALRLLGGPTLQVVQGGKAAADVHTERVAGYYDEEKTAATEGGDEPPMTQEQVEAARDLAASAEHTATPEEVAQTTASASDDDDPFADAEPVEGETTVEALGLPIRAYNGLIRAGIKTLNQIVTYTREQLLEVDGIGKAALERIESSLEVVNRKLAESPEPEPEPAAEQAPAATEAPARPAGKKAEEPTLADARAALMDLNQAPGKGMVACRKITDRFEVARVSDLKPERYAEFIAACQEEKNAK